MAASNPSALLADALAAVSKTAYQAFADIETQARSEVTRAVAETREARNERDKAVKELHTTQLEWQAWKQETAACKASLQQAELTIVHQTENIAQLKRELSQWKDQSRNWQEHFLRVEQERCALSSRMEELVSERLQWPRSAVSSGVPFTPKQRYTDLISSAPSSTTTKRASIPSPTQPPSYKSAAGPSGSGVDSRSQSPHPAQPSTVTSSKQSKTKPKTSLTGRGELPPYKATEVSRVAKEESTSVSQSPRKQKPLPRSPVRALRPDPPTITRSTVVRRVHAVVHVKQEGSDSESVKEEEPEEEEVVRTSRRRSRKIVEDEEEESHDALDALADDDEEDDELMMGAEDHEEVYGYASADPVIPPSRPKGTPLPPKKRRKTGKAA
ncbi:hypothetical protein BDQ12DRAFT_664282 [Crucibulum laeve]|uniref:Uncharacterized protein n=1 Tax=Crucibulum laeve TaxID=68775 RepID=A0A5C3M7Z8_9AGAR|nr:hypothetical protein BDQ12DRAFT_664282 [Crucibulum laeve]